MALALVSTGARAQSVDLSTFEPAPAGQRFFGLPTAETPGHWRFSGELVGAYARNPALVRTPSARVVAPLVSDLFVLHAAAALTLWERATIGVDFPFAVASGTAGPLAVADPNAVRAGDLRLSAQAELWTLAPRAAVLGLGGYLWVPTGGAYASTGAVRGAPFAVLSGHLGPLVYSATAGAALGPSRQLLGEQVPGDTFRGAAGVAVLLGPREQLQIGPETTWAVALEESATSAVSGDVRLGVKWSFLREWTLGAAAGTGFFDALGTPELSVLASLAYVAPKSAPEPPAPRVPARRPSRAPAPPADRDGDGVPDAVDACPDRPGPARSDPARSGCPDEPARREPVPTETLVGPFFATGSAALDARSLSLIDAVVARLRNEPELDVVITVEGHADSRGAASFNQQLSERRAEAVAEALMARGVAAERLRVEAYGEERPVATNTTAAGRQQNRRFTLVVRDAAEAR